jgi:malonate transporter
VTLLNAILPIFLLIGLGRALASTKLLDKAGWSAVERLGLYVLFPALIVSVLSKAEFSWTALSLIGVLVAAQALMALIALGAHLWPGMERPAIASTIQSNVRWNALIALPLAEALLGSEGLALMAVASAGMIPTANLISITAFEAYGARNVSLRRKMLSVIANPFMVACLVGVALGLSGVNLMASLGNSLDMLSRGAIAIGLLSAGAAIDFPAMKSGRFRLIFWSLVRLVILPLLVVTLTFAFGLSGIPRNVAIIAAVSPTAINGVLLARQLNGDAVFAANLIALQTLLSLVTIPVLLWLFATI